jgi:uncharacterized protein YcaQ
MATWHTRQGSIEETFARLRSVQFDPLSPAGCNHDLVLQARVSGYQVGDWQRLAYQDRAVYDGWDKMACLVPYGGWPARRVIHRWHEPGFSRIFKDHPHAVDAVLEELSERGPLLPKEFEFQEKKPEWRGSWFGPNLTKQTLRALWHTGRVMTHSRKGQHHVYDLTERVVPADTFEAPEMTDFECVSAILLDRYAAVGIIRPGASYEVWAMHPKKSCRRDVLKDLVQRGLLIEVKVDGSTAHATPEFLESIGVDAPPDRVTFFGPLDQIMWDRKMIQYLFGFDYVWEVYKPEAQRKWGYYVLPVLYRDRFIARFDVWLRNGLLEIRSWHWEPDLPRDSEFWPALEDAFRRFLSYGSAKKIQTPRGAGAELRQVAKAAARA